MKIILTSWTLCKGTEDPLGTPGLHFENHCGKQIKLNQPIALRNHAVFKNLSQAQNRHWSTSHSLQPYSLSLIILRSLLSFNNNPVSLTTGYTVSLWNLLKNPVKWS